MPSEKTKASRELVNEVAHLFLDVVLKAQAELDLPKTQIAIAEIVHEVPQAFNDVLSGRTGSLDRVCRWVILWNRNRPNQSLVLAFSGVPVVATIEREEIRI